LLENLITTEAKNLDSFPVSRINCKEYFKEKVSKFIEQNSRYKRFGVGNATVQYERNSLIYVWIATFLVQLTWKNENSPKQFLSSIFYHTICLCYTAKISQHFIVFSWRYKILQRKCTIVSVVQGKNSNNLLKFCAVKIRCIRLQYKQKRFSK
jgi:hypothetical protein